MKRKLLTAWAVLTLVFLMLPILVVMPLSFSDGLLLMYPIKEWSLRWYAEVIGAEHWRRATMNTLIVSPTATLLATLAGTAAAVGLHRKAPGRVRELLMAVFVSPAIMPLVVVGLAVYLFYAPHGLGTGYPIMILTHAVLGAPFVLLVTLSTLARLDPLLANASASLGAGPWRTFLCVTLPTIAPGVAIGALFAFITSCDEVITTLFLSTPKTTLLSMAMLEGLRENVSPAIAVVATLLGLLAGALMLLLCWLRARAREMEGHNPSELNQNARV